MEPHRCSTAGSRSYRVVKSRGRPSRYCQSIRVRTHSAVCRTGKVPGPLQHSHQRQPGRGLAQPARIPNACAKSSSRSHSPNRSQISTACGGGRFTRHFAAIATTIRESGARRLEKGQPTGAPMMDDDPWVVVAGRSPHGDVGAAVTVSGMSERVRDLDHESARWASPAGWGIYSRSLFWAGCHNHARPRRGARRNWRAPLADSVATGIRLAGGGCRLGQE